MKINTNITEKRQLSHYRILQEHYILQLIVVMIEIVLKINVKCGFKYFCPTLD
jgi:hypothetical protein